MTYENFKNVLDNIRERDNFFNTLYHLNVDMTDSVAINETAENERILFTEIYGEEGYEWISWYLYEQPHFEALIVIDGDKKEYHAWDENGEPMDLSSDDKLWDMLEKDYKIGGKYHDCKRTK